ncbi:MAG TPA: SH3 domain-containing protein [Thermoanaerobaculia bacterium]|nr:SH3 domain-containing protein [Thermoanaerobaculia bacterium]
MKSRFAAALCLLLFAGCGGNTPAPAPAPEPRLAMPAPNATTAEDHAIGTIRVNVSTLNVRGEPSTSAEVVAHVRRGERLTAIADSGDWLRVKLRDGTTGWVSSELVIREGAAARPRRGGCPPDSDCSFVTAPKPAFSEGGPHGMVVIEANVDVRGIVTSTRIVSNETHDDALASMAGREVRNARFAPPVRNCVTRAFVFTYKRAF